MNASEPEVPPEARLLVDGQLVAAADGASYRVVDPATGEPVREVPDAGPADLDRAVGSARRALDRTSWGQDDALRHRCLDQLHRALVAQAPQLRALTTAATGMPVALLATEYDEPVAELRALLDEEDSDKPRTRQSEVRAVITPWTSPHRVALDRVGAALLTGHTVVLKPAPANALLACELARLVAEATEIPPGVLSVLPSRDVDVAIALTTDPRVDAVSFAGSAVVADRVRHQAGEAGKSVELEVGDARTVGVGERDDLEEVVRDTVHEVALHAGQRTGAPTRLVVPERWYDDAVSLAAMAMREIAPGDPNDPATVCGPLVSAVQRDRVRRYLALAGHEGGRVVCGGGPVPGRDRGYWIEPAVVAGVEPDARVATEEVLGPVLVVVPRRT